MEMPLKHRVRRMVSNLISTTYLQYTGEQELDRSNEEDAGIDLKSNDWYEIKARSSAIIDTSSSIALPPGTVGFIWPRSGLSVKHDIETGAGVVDSGYTGVIKVKLYNMGSRSYLIGKGDRIAQLVIVPFLALIPDRVSVLGETERGLKGFGSSGR